MIIRVARFVVLFLALLTPALGEGHYSTSLRQAAERGNAVAQYLVGLCYITGQGIQQNHAEATAWFRKAAEQGNVKAQFSLGRCFYDTKGISQDYNEAVRWFRVAAEQGHAEAQFYLGMCFHDGEGVPQNYNEAVAWWRKAATQGSAKARFGLGMCYGKGEGVSLDLVESYFWITLSSKEVAEAQNLRELLVKHMTPEQIAEGERRVAAVVQPQARLSAKAQGSSNGSASAPIQVEPPKSDAAKVEAQFNGAAPKLPEINTTSLPQPAEPIQDWHLPESTVQMGNPLEGITPDALMDYRLHSDAAVALGVTKRTYENGYRADQGIVSALVTITIIVSIIGFGIFYTCNTCKPSKTEISFECPYCRQHLEAAADLRGHSVPCPTCKKGLIIPA